MKGRICVEPVAKMAASQFIAQLNSFGVRFCSIGRDGDRDSVVINNSRDDAVVSQSANGNSYT